MAAHDTVVVAALRSALSALDNAEAVQAPSRPAPTTDYPHIAGSVAGLGASEVERRHLTPARVAELLTGEIADRLAAASEYEQWGRPDRAERLWAEADVLSRYLPQE